MVTAAKRFANLIETLNRTDLMRAVRVEQKVKGLGSMVMSGHINSADRKCAELLLSLSSPDRLVFGVEGRYDDNRTIVNLAVEVKPLNKGFTKLEARVFDRSMSATSNPDLADALFEEFKQRLAMPTIELEAEFKKNFVDHLSK